MATVQSSCSPSKAFASPSLSALVAACATSEMYELFSNHLPIVCSTNKTSHSTLSFVLSGHHHISKSKFVILINSWSTIRIMCEVKMGSLDSWEPLDFRTHFKGTCKNWQKTFWNPYSGQMNSWIEIVNVFHKELTVTFSDLSYSIFISIHRAVQLYTQCLAPSLSKALSFLNFYINLHTQYLEASNIPDTLQNHLSTSINGYKKQSLIFFKCLCFDLPVGSSSGICN